jgi:type IV fimbrial biogenesis protein FimT
MKFSNNFKSQGFTLIELMIGITIVGVVVAMALPSYNNTVKNTCMTTNTNTLISSIQMARSEATKLRQDISIVSKSGNWGTGWTVQDESAVILNDVDLTCGSTTIEEQGSDATLVYESTGFIDEPAVFDVCDDRTGETGRQITINLVGRPSTNRAYICP